MTPRLFNCNPPATVEQAEIGAQSKDEDLLNKPRASGYALTHDLEIETQPDACRDAKTKVMDTKYEWHSSSRRPDDAVSTAG